MNHTPAAIRKFISKSFNDEELETLCFDYFPEVSEDFTGGMTKGQKVRALIGYCQRRERMRDLLGALERERPDQYQKEFPSNLQVEAQAQAKVHKVPSVRDVTQLPRDPDAMTIIWE